MKKLSLAGLACTAIATTVVFTQPTIATEKPPLPIVQATNQVTSTQIATSNDDGQEERTLDAQKPARRASTPLDIFAGVMIVSSALAIVIFKQQIGYWTIKQVNKLAKLMNLDPLE
jgi:hypothetical protein